jgi:arylformamidase
MRIYDISVPITPSMPTWPGDPPIELRLDSAIAAGDTANVSRLSMGVHTGTHIDAPKHFIDDGKTIGWIPLIKLIGEVLVLVVDSKETVISEQVLITHPGCGLLKSASKVLFRTRNSLLWQTHPHTFIKDYVGIDRSGAIFLNQFKLDLIGIDYLSIAPYEETDGPHQILLANETVLLEGLDLSDVPGGNYELFCLPLRLPDCEGAPARVILVDKMCE